MSAGIPYELIIDHCNRQARRSPAALRHHLARLERDWPRIAAGEWDEDSRLAWEAWSQAVLGRLAQAAEPQERDFWERQLFSLGPWPANTEPAEAAEALRLRCLWASDRGWPSVKEARVALVADTPPELTDALAELCRGCEDERDLPESAQAALEQLVFQSAGIDMRWETALFNQSFAAYAARVAHVLALPEPGPRALAGIEREAVRIVCRRLGAPAQLLEDEEDPGLGSVAEQALCAALDEWLVAELQHRFATVSAFLEAACSARTTQAPGGQAGWEDVRRVLAGFHTDTAVLNWKEVWPSLTDRLAELA